MTSDELRLGKMAVLVLEIDDDDGNDAIVLVATMFGGGTGGKEFIIPCEGGVSSSPSLSPESGSSFMLLAPPS